MRYRQRRKAKEARIKKVKSRKKKLWSRRSRNETLEDRDKGDSAGRRQRKGATEGCSVFCLLLKIFPTQGQFLLSSAPAPPVGMSCFLPPTPQKGQREGTTPLTSLLLFFICPSDLISCLLFSVVNAVTTTIKLSLSRNEIMTKNTSFILLRSQLHLFLRAVGGAREEYYIVLYTL